jgi:hypothetical protein
MVVHAYSPSYLEGGNRKIIKWRPAHVKVAVDILSQKMKIKGLMV